MVRRNPPRLVQPEKVVSRETERALGLRSQLQLQRDIGRLARRNDLDAGTPIVVSGSWADGSAGKSLCAALAALGLIVDLTN